MKYRVYIMLLFWVAIGNSYAQQLRKKVGSNPNLIDASAVFEVESTTKGFLPPRMTQTEMNAIATPATGLLVYCTNCSPAGFQLYDGSAWGAINSGGASVVANCNSDGFKGNYYKNISVTGATFSTTITNNSFTAVTINFAASDLVLSGAAGFSVGTPTPSTATITPGQSQLVSYPITGTPTSTNTLTGTWTKVSLSCIKTQAVDPTPCGAYTSTGKFLVFQCYNLGAVENGSPFTPSWQLNGGYIQWGHNGAAGGWTNNAFFGYAAGPSDGTSTGTNKEAVSGWNTSPVVSDTSWNMGTNTSPVRTINDPCPSGYRVPTQNEWASIINANTPWNDVPFASWSNSATNYSSGRTAGSYLYLPAAGYRYGNNGALDWRGTAGWYWSSTSVVSNSASYNLLIQPSYVTAADYGTNNRTNAYSVRCIKDKQ